MVIAKNKKVKLQMDNTIKNMNYKPPNNQDVGVPRAIFIPHSKSLPFDERRVTLEQPVKIGRNVYRATPTPTNTIFECRVLSRHHATLYYDKGHFYLVDNRSSNGTFINNNRCSISMEQEPHEVFSGDVVQFGIPVEENSAFSERNTFPPVVAILKLFHPDGKEAKLSFNTIMTTPLYLKDLYQLNNFLEEAIEREACLEERLTSLRECVKRTRAEAQASWELFVGEQRLLMRVHRLESMLALGEQPDPHHIAQLLTDKKNYQDVAQESLRAAHEQRLVLEESLERRTREAAALRHRNCALRTAASTALAELQKVASRCERKLCAARLAIAAAEEREQTTRTRLPLAYSVQNGEAKMLVVSADSNRAAELRGSLEDAVRALPDYIKLLLPPHVLHKVGIKVISAEGKSAKEFELILKQNNIYDAENKEKQQLEEPEVGGSGEEKPAETDLCTDDEKQSRLNHDQEHEVECSSPLDGELCPDNNANSTYGDADNREESPSKAGVEYANVLRVMAGLNEEIKVLRERLGACSLENEQLRNVRDELLAAQAEARDDPPPDAEDAAGYRARIAELQEQLTRSTAAEEANLAEIQRLASSAAELQTKLTFRPTRADVDDLIGVISTLRADLLARERAALAARAPDRTTADKCVETDPPRPDTPPPPPPARPDLDPSLDTSKIIDEMFRLDEDDADDTDSATTEVNRDEAETSEYVRLADEERLQVTLANGSLHALEEELVRAKERWEEVCGERARLAAQLAELQSKTLAPAPRALALLMFLVPVAVAALCYLMLPHVS